MSIATVVTLGYGSFGSVNFVATLGYGNYATAAADGDLVSGGSYYGYRAALARESAHDDKRLKKRRKQLRQIAELIDGITEDMPSDVPEAQAAKQAQAAVEEAAERLDEDASVFDHAGLAAAVRQAEAAVRQAQAAHMAYQARVAQALAEQDDEDVLLLMA